MTAWAWAFAGNCDTETGCFEFVSLKHVRKKADGVWCVLGVCVSVSVSVCVAAGAECGSVVLGEFSRTLRSALGIWLLTAFCWRSVNVRSPVCVFFCPSNTSLTSNHSLPMHNTNPTSCLMRNCVGYQLRTAAAFRTRRSAEESPDCFQCEARYHGQERWGGGGGLQAGGGCGEIKKTCIIMSKRFHGLILKTGAEIFMNAKWHEHGACMSWIKLVLNCSSFCSLWGAELLFMMEENLYITDWFYLDLWFCISMAHWEKTYWSPAVSVLL